MVDFAMDVFRQLYKDKEVPKELKDKRVTVVSELKSLQAAVVPITTILEDPHVTEQIQNSRDGRQLFETLQKDHEFKPEYLDVLYNFAKFQYECGNYSGAAEYLYFHRVLAPPSDKNFMNALWGKLASEILMQNWDTALEDVNRIKEIIDSGGQVGGMSLGGMANPLQALQQRAWLIHWSLFVFFNHPKGRDHIIDLFLFQPQYLNTIQTMCPHILRYLTTAVITNKRRKNVIKDLVKVIQQSHTHTKILSRSSSSVCTSLSTSTLRKPSCASARPSSSTTSSSSPVSTILSKTPDFLSSKLSAGSISASQLTCWLRS